MLDVLDKRYRISARTFALIAFLYPVLPHPSHSGSCAGVSTLACADVNGLQLFTLCALCGSLVGSGLRAAAGVDQH